MKAATMLDEQKLAAALQNVTGPLVISLKDFGNKLERHRIAMAGSIAEIKADIKYLKDGQQEAWKRVDAVREEHMDCEARKNWPLVASFLRKDEITAVTRLQKSSVVPASAMTTKDSGEIKISVSKKFVRTTLPWILTAILIGAALAGAAILGGSIRPETAVKTADQGSD